MAASAALGGVGILLGMGVTAWGAIEHSRDRPAMEAEIRQELRSGLDAMWNDVLANFDDTVMGAVHHISSEIDVRLLLLYSAGAGPGARV